MPQATAHLPFGRRVHAGSLRGWEQAWQKPCSCLTLPASPGLGLWSQAWRWTGVLLFTGVPHLQPQCRMHGEGQFLGCGCRCSILPPTDCPPLSLDLNTPCIWVCTAPQQPGCSLRKSSVHGFPWVPSLSFLLPLPASLPPLLSSLQSLTSLFYGEQSEKEKSPSESSPLDVDNKDVVSSQRPRQGQPGAALGIPGSLRPTVGCSQGTHCQ